MTFYWNDLENEILAPEASKACNSRGRKLPEEESEFRTCYQRDRDRIIHSKAFRRLKDKTQVFVCADGDHYRTRLTHTLEVAQISRTVARALKLNEDLVEAIALGHDLGHTPFGHAGERSLQKLTGRFFHNEQSLRVVEFIENEGKGLNLSYEVLDGIVAHSSHAPMPKTLEGQIVRICDRIAYVNHDIDDSIRAGLIKTEDLPLSTRKLLGERHSERINSLVKNLVETSSDLKEIRLSNEYDLAMNELRAFLFDTVYKRADAIEQEKELDKIIQVLYEYYMNNLHKLPSIFEKSETGVCDYIAGMTDSFALDKYVEITGNIK